MTTTKQNDYLHHRNVSKDINLVISNHYEKTDKDKSKWTWRR